MKLKTDKLYVVFNKKKTGKTSETDVFDRHARTLQELFEVVRRRKLHANDIVGIYTTLGEADAAAKKVIKKINQKDTSDENWVPSPQLANEIVKVFKDPPPGYIGFVKSQLRDRLWTVEFEAPFRYTGDKKWYRRFDVYDLKGNKMFAGFILSKYV